MRFSAFLCFYPFYIFFRVKKTVIRRETTSKKSRFFLFRALDSLRTAVKKLILIFIFVFSKIPVTHLPSWRYLLLLRKVANDEIVSLPFHP